MVAGPNVRLPIIFLFLVKSEKYGLMDSKNVFIQLLTRRDIYTIIRTGKQTSVREQMFCLRVRKEN